MDLTSTTGVFGGSGGVSSMKRRPNLYKFPILKSSDVIQCLKELSSGGEHNIVLTKEELEEPQHCKEKVRNIFVFLLNYCAGKDASNLKPAKETLEYVSKLEYPDLHPHDSYTEMLFFVSLRQLMEQCLYSEFSWRDLHAPTSKRLRIQLSALINLVKYFQGDPIKLYNDLNGPRLELIQALGEVQVEHEEFKKDFEIAESNANSKRNELEKAIRECEELEVEIARNNRLQTASRREGATIKKKVNSLNDQVQSLQWALQEIEAEEEKLRSLVVSSPERRKAELAEMNTKLQNEKDECNRLEGAVQECKRKYANARKLHHEFTDCIKDMEELKEEASKYTDLVEKLTQVRKEIDETVKRTDEVNAEIFDAERDLHRIEEKIKSQRLQHQLNMQAIQETLDSAKKDLLQAEKDRRDAMARIEAGEKEVLALQALIDQEQSKTKSEIHTMISNYKKLEKQYIEKNDKRMQQILAINFVDSENKENVI